MAKKTKQNKPAAPAKEIKTDKRFLKYIGSTVSNEHTTAAPGIVFVEIINTRDKKELLLCDLAKLPAAVLKTIKNKP